MWRKYEKGSERNFIQNQIFLYFLKVALFIECRTDLCFRLTMKGKMST